MASLSTAINRTTGSIIPSALVVVGSLGATVATDVLKRNVYDVPWTGGDAAYPVLAALVLNGFFGGSRSVRLISYGMMASSISEVANAYDIV